MNLVSYSATAICQSPSKPQVAVTVKASTRAGVVRRVVALAGEYQSQAPGARFSVGAIKREAV